MITGLHTFLYSDDPDATKAFFRDVLNWPHLDSDGQGWLLFRTPPTELGVHPATAEDGHRWADVPRHDISLMCDDLEATIAELKAKHVTFLDEVSDQGYALAITIEVPGAGPMQIYQPRYQPAYTLDE